MCYEPAAGMEICLGGGDHSQGNVFIDGRPICDENWYDEDAGVVCRQLGFNLGAPTGESQ